jgi:FkbM family methyltransferase
VVLGAISLNIRNNLPSAKPELWHNVPAALFKRAVLGWRQRFGELGECEISLCNGLRMRVDLADAIGRSMYLYRSYEFAASELIRQQLRPGMTFFDVGANLGYYSLLASPLTGEAGRVFAFEAVPAIVASLEANIHRNQLHNVKVVPSAVCDYVGKITMYANEDRANSGLSTLDPTRCAGGKAFTAPAVTLDSVVEQYAIGSVDVIKIDVEGCELSVLKGATALLGRASPPQIMFESESSDQLAEQFLQERGYSLYEVWLDRGRAALSPYSPTCRRTRAYEARNLFATKRAAREIGTPIIE